MHLKPVDGSAALPVPIIDTERLRLRLLGAEHASICAAYALRNKDFHAASAPRRTDEFYSSEYWAKRLAGSVQRFNQGTSIEFFIFDRLDDGVVLGECAFDGFAFGVFQACYLGYNLDARQTGNGYMHEALSAALDYVFSEVHIHRVMANYMPTNQPSANVLKRLGFRIEGYAREYLQLNGIWQDHILTALHRNEWSGI